MNHSSTTYRSNHWHFASAFLIAALLTVSNVAPSNAQFVHITAVTDNGVQEFLVSESGVHLRESDGSLSDLSVNQTEMLIGLLMDDGGTFAQQSEEDDDNSSVVDDAINWLFDKLFGGDSSEQPTDGGGGSGGDTTGGFDDDTGGPEDDDTGNPNDDDEDIDLTDDEIDDMIQFWQPDRGFDRDGDDLVVRYFQSGRVEVWQGQGGTFEEDAHFDHCIHAPNVVDPNWGHETERF